MASGNPTIPGVHIMRLPSKLEERSVRATVRTGSGSHGGTATEKAPWRRRFRRRADGGACTAAVAEPGRRVRPRGVRPRVTGNRELPCHSGARAVQLEVNFTLKARGREHRPLRQHGVGPQSAMDRAAPSESSGGARDQLGACQKASRSRTAATVTAAVPLSWPVAVAVAVAVSGST